MVEMIAWLEELGLGQYAPIFAANDIDLEILSTLSEAELGGLGLSLGHRKRLLQAIAELARRPARVLDNIVEAERRQITVMFCDLVGSTELSARLDPEELYELIQLYQRVCSEAVGRHGGFVAQYLGDGILVYFGYPHAHERDAERAIRAGLTVIEAVAGIAAPAGISLEVRIGVATGQAVVGDLIGRGLAAQPAVTGKTPNLAARVQVLARPNTMVITEGTRRLVADRFECEDLGVHHLKGIDDEVRAWLVVRERTEAELFDARQTALVACVGRDRELALLLDRWRLAVAGTGQTVVVSGEAGIGKSRLVTHLREHLTIPDYTCIHLQCSEHHRNTPLYPMIAHLRSAARFELADSATAKLDKIERMMLPAGNSKAAPLVAALLSVPFGDRYLPLALPARQQRTLTLELLVTRVFGLATSRPVLVLVEDVQWIDPTTEEVLIRLRERLLKHRVLLLLVTRPDNASRLIDDRQAMTLLLGPLSRAASEDLISEVTRGKRLPAEVAEQILDKTDGVPLFIEELTKTVLESGLLREERDTYLLDGPAEAMAIPSTLQDSLKARLDRLVPVKEVAQVGAAIGRSFSYRLIATVMNQEERFVGAALERLVDARMIHQRGTPPDAVYTFRHALVQEAAYESLLRSRKSVLHARIVRAIDTHFDEIAETEPEILAHHFARADLHDKAAEYWLKAGQAALRRSANLEAINHLRNGIRQLPAIAAADDRARLELELQLTLGQASLAARGYTAIETTHAFARAAQLAETIGVLQQRCSALYGAFVGYLIGGRLDLAGETVTRLFKLASEDGDSGHLCLAHRLHGSFSFFSGDLPTACEHLQKALALCGTEQQRQLALRFGPHTETAAQIFLAMTEWLLGRPESASRRAERTVASVRQLDHALSAGQVLSLAAQLNYMAQDYERMHDLSKEGAECCAKGDIRYFGAICRPYRIWAQAHLSDLGDSAAAFGRDMAIYEQMDCGLQLSLFHCMLAQLLLAAAQPTSALKETETALSIVTASGERWWAPEIHRIRGECLLALAKPDFAEAEQCFRRAAEDANRMHATMLELRAAVSLAKLLSRRGQPAEARRTLEPIYRRFTEGFDTADLRAAKALLDQQPSSASSRRRAQSRRRQRNTANT